MKCLYGLASSMLSVLVLMVFVLLLSGCDGDREQYTGGWWKRLRQWPVPPSPGPSERRT